MPNAEKGFNQPDPEVLFTEDLSGEQKLENFRNAYGPETTEGAEIKSLPNLSEVNGPEKQERYFFNQYKKEDGEVVINVEDKQGGHIRQETVPLLEYYLLNSDEQMKNAADLKVPLSWVMESWDRSNIGAPSLQFMDRYGEAKEEALDWLDAKEKNLKTLVSLDEAKSLLKENYAAGKAAAEKEGSKADPDQLKINHARRKALFGIEESPATK